MSNTETAKEKVNKMISDAEVAMNTAKTAMNEAETEMNNLKTDMDTAKTEMSAMVNWKGAVKYPNTQTNYETKKKQYETKKKEYETKKKEYEMKKKEYNEKNKIFLELTANREQFNNDDEFLKSIDAATLYKLQNPVTSSFASAFKAISPAPISSSRSNQALSGVAPPPTPADIIAVEDKPGKEITIKFIQDSNNQCFITDYNICDIQNSKELIKIIETELKERLVIDANSQSVRDNIQNLSKIVTPNCPATTAGGYDANKRSRSVGTKRKTMRQPKRQIRRSRRSRPSRFSL
jgi:hypothetical protein